MRLQLSHLSGFGVSFGALGHAARRPDGKGLLLPTQLCTWCRRTEDVDNHGHVRPGAPLRTTSSSAKHDGEGTPPVSSHRTVDPRESPCATSSAELVIPAKPARVNVDTSTSLFKWKGLHIYSRILVYFVSASSLTLCDNLPQLTHEKPMFITRYISEKG